MNFLRKYPEEASGWKLKTKINTIQDLILNSFQ